MSQSNNKMKIDKNKEYTWEELSKLNFNKDIYLIYIQNYQDYWISWSPDSNKIMALAINQKDIGIHIIDLTTFTYKLNDQNIFVPFNLISIKNKPLYWKAPILTEPMQQGFPSWCRVKNIVTYGEFSLDFKTSKLIIYNLDDNNYYQEEFKIIPKIEGIDFSWKNEDLAVYGNKVIIVYNCKKKDIVFSWEAPSEIEQAGWFPNDDFLFVVYNNKGYKINYKDKLIKPEEVIDLISWSKFAFIPNTKEAIIAKQKGFSGGLFIYNYETKKIVKKITNGFHYQPQVSPDGKWVSYISQGPLGGFISSIDINIE